MENATKALIIAGAVLVSILLISFGIVLVNQNKKTVESATEVSTKMETATETAKGKAVTAIEGLSETTPPAGE